MLVSCGRPQGLIPQKSRELFRPKVIFLEFKKKGKKVQVLPKKRFIHFPDIFHLLFRTVNILISSERRKQKQILGPKRDCNFAEMHPCVL